MKNYVVESYENYNEECRLTTNNARKIEFLTTTKIFESLLKNNSKILDCAAGTGVYSFWLSERGYDVTATDITPRHIDYINRELSNKSYTFKTAVLDATDMSIFADEEFDVVLNMGPFYHLVTEELREKCLNECIRVLKKGGILVTAYIPRFSVFPYIAVKDEKYLNSTLANQLVDTGVLKHDDEMCFWTDTYYYSKEEMERLYNAHNLEIIDHFAQDGLSPLLSSKIDSLSDEKFKIWCEYHFSVCREPSILGSSNHTAIVGKKA